MTGKVPVDRTIADGYGFVFRNFLSILGIVWLPYLVFAILCAGLVWLIAPGLPRMILMHELDMTTIIDLSRLAVLVAVLGFVTGCMVTVGVQTKALGLHPRPVWFYYSLGAPVWRMAGAFFLAGIVVFLIALVTAGVCVAIWYAADRLGDAAGIVHIADVCAGAAFILYILIRLLFFLPAVVVAEGTIGLERAWILGGHNFWRIVIVVVAIVLPVAIVFHLLFWALFGPLAGLPMGVHMSLREIMRAALQLGAASPFALLFQILERIVLVGVTNGAAASATSTWRRPVAAPTSSAPCRARSSRSSRRTGRPWRPATRSSCSRR